MNLQELICMEPLKCSQVVAGKQSLDREVGDITVMEVPDIEDYVKKGDFLLTTLFPVHKDPDKLARIIPTLDQIGLCGIGVKPNRYLGGYIPHIILNQANALDFPLIILSDKVNFSDVMAHYLREKLHKRNTQLQLRYSSEFAYDILLGEPLTLDLALSRARAIDWHLIFPVAIIIVDVSSLPNDYHHRDQFCNQIRQDVFRRIPIDRRQLFTASIGNEIVLLLNDEAIKKQEYIVQEVYQAVTQNITHCHIGISNYVENIDSFKQCFKNGRKAVEIARLTGKTSPLDFRDAGIYRVLHHSHIRDELLAFCEDMIGSIITHDKQYHTEYLKTLEIIFHCNGNHKKAAQALYIHYNTLRYRIKMIAQILGLEASSLHYRQDIYLAVTAYKLFC